MLIIKIYQKGGALAIDDLSKIIAAAEVMKCKHFQFGKRQEIILQIQIDSATKAPTLLNGFDYDIGDSIHSSRQNIVTSLLATDVVPSTYWLRDSVYHEILDTFEEPSDIRINISDLKQDIVYSFTGDLNFVASEEVNYWHAYVRLDGLKTLQLLPYLVHSEDLQRCSRQVSTLLNDKPDWNSFVERIGFLMGDRLVASTHIPHVRVPEFYNYEGLHDYKNKHWIGFYEREAGFNLNFLKAVVKLCQQQRIGKIHITPWKSILVRSIDDEGVTEWKSLVAQFNINIGHAHSELNWQLNDFDDEALKLKAHVRKMMIRHDIASNGVIFGINQNLDYTFSHIVIKTRKTIFGMVNDIYYRRNFNPIKSAFLLFAKGVAKKDIHKVLKELISKYTLKAYEEEAKFEVSSSQIEVDQYDSPKQSVEVHECSSCLTHYNPTYGDPESKIQPGAPFDSLEEYTCPTCGADKSYFKLYVDPKLLISQ